LSSSEAKLQEQQEEAEKEKEEEEERGKACMESGPAVKSTCSQFQGHR
jgi:hypothetical protein